MKKFSFSSSNFNEKSEIKSFKNFIKRFSKICLFTSFFAFFLMPILDMQAFASNFDLNQNVEIVEDIEEDTYVISGNSVIDSNIYGDLYIISGNVVVNGDVSEDLMVLGRANVTIHGNVGGDVRVLGGQVFVYGDIAEDLLVSAGQIDISKNSTISGDLLASAYALTMDGIVEGDLKGSFSVLFLNGRVNGDASLNIQDAISIGDHAKIAGNLDYFSFLESDIEEGVVGGDLIFNKFEINDMGRVSIFVKLIGFLASLLLMILLVIFAPKSLTRASNLARKNLIKTFVLGFLTVIVLFILPIILIVSIIGVQLAMIILANMMIILYLSKIFACAFVGSYFLNYKRQLKGRKLFIYLFFILLAYYILLFIPYVWGVNVILSIFGIGAIVLLLNDYRHFLKGKKMM